MKNIKKSFATPSSKPVDVEYRLKRATATLAETAMFIRAIDKKAFPEGMLKNILAMTKFLDRGLYEARKVAPAKRARKPKAELAAAVAVIANLEEAVAAHEEITAAVETVAEVA